MGWWNHWIKTTKYKLQYFYCIICTFACKVLMFWFDLELWFKRGFFLISGLSTTQPGKSKKPRQNFIPGVPPTSLLQPSHPGLHHASPYQKSLLSPPSVTSQHLQNGFPHHPSHHHHHHHLVTTTGVPHRPPPPNERAAAVAVAALLNSPHHLLPGPPAVAGPPGVLDHTGSAKSPGGSVLPTHPFGHHVTQVSHATSLLLDANHKRSKLLLFVLTGLIASVKSNIRYCQVNVRLNIWPF